MRTRIKSRNNAEDKNRNTKKKGKKIIIVSLILLVIIGGFFLFGGKILSGMSKKVIAVSSLSVIEKVTKLLPIEKDTKKEIEVINKLVETVMASDGVERRYLLLLQNNMELRPGGGFLGQYAIVKIKNGDVTSLLIEDANLLDQRISAKVAPPYPFKRMMQLKKWKFRDSNFSADFPTNVEKAKYFYKLSGGNNEFDGVIAVNAGVLNHVLAITGPITVPGYSGEYNSENAFLKLEEVVEKPYLLNEELDTQNRKAIMKKMAPIIVKELMSIGNIKKVVNLTLEELRNKNVMINFEDQELQSLAEEVHWDGSANKDWSGDYLMIVDANMGALKSDYYIDRDIVYNVDLTGEKPMATLEYTYAHNATQGDWRTSDYHSYLRVYVPKGSNLIERVMVSYPNIQEEFGKSYFGFIAHTLINDQTKAIIKYELPEFVKDDYKLLIQKQSGVGDVPVKINVKSDKGEFHQEIVLKKDAEFVFGEE